MAGSDTVVLRSQTDIHKQKEGTTLQYCAKLVRATSLIMADPENIDPHFDYMLLIGKESARQWIEQVAEKDHIERRYLAQVSSQYGPTAVDEIKAAAFCRLCKPISPLLAELGVLFSPWFSHPNDAYTRARQALNSERKNFTNRRKSWRKHIGSLCGALIHDGALIELQADAYSGEGGDSVDVSGEVAGTAPPNMLKYSPAPAESVDDIAHLSSMVAKVDAFVRTRSDPQERHIASLLRAGELSVSEIMKEARVGRLKVTLMHNRLAEAVGEYRSEPSKKRKPYVRKKIPKLVRKLTEMDVAVAAFNAFGRKYGYVNTTLPPLRLTSLGNGRKCCRQGQCWECKWYDGFKMPKHYRPSSIVTDPEMVAVIAAIDGWKARIARESKRDQVIKPYISPLKQEELAEEEEIAASLPEVNSNPLETGWDL